MNASELSWGVNTHPQAKVGRDRFGDVWLALIHHPLGPQEGRVRAQATATEVLSNGIPFVRLDWIREEYARAIERAAGKMNLHEVIRLTHMRDIGLDVFEKQAPHAPAAS